MRQYCVLHTIFLVLTVPGLLSAQSAGGGSIAGHIRGPGGVSVPGATVEATEVQTGEHKATWSDEAGNYVLAGLRTGTYRLGVSLLGFRKEVRESVTVAPEKPIQADVALVMALEEPSGPVRARADGRPFGAQRGLEAGADLNVRVSGETGREEQTGTGLQEADTSSAANSFLLSGGVSRAGEPGGDETKMRERIEEFRRNREGQSGLGFGGGPFGEGGPGVVFMGGGRGGGGGGGRGGGGGNSRRALVNRIRGNFFDQYSNSALNARLYPLNAPQVRKIASYQENAGISLGGPLVIPKIYHGAEKTSFFLNYQHGQGRRPYDTFSTVPTAAERAGDFSQTVIPSGPLAGTVPVPVLYNPGIGGGTPSGAPTPFPGNQIPFSMFDQAVKGLLPFIPLPTLPGSVQNFHLQEALPASTDRFMGRVGHRLSAKDNFNFFYFLNSDRTDSVGNFPSLTWGSSVLSQSGNFGETHTFSPQRVNQLMVNWTRQRNSTLNPFAFRQDVSGELGVTGVSKDPRDWGLPIIQFTNFTGLNDTIPSLNRNQTLRLMDFVIWSSGKHNLRFGGEMRRVQVNSLVDPDARGTYTFTGFTTSSFNQGFPLAGTGSDFADFLLGLPQTTSVRFGTSANYLRSWVWACFVQDDWRVSPRWTLNLGLRYEYFEPFREKYGHLSDLLIGPNFSSVAVVTGLSPGGLPSSLIRGDRNNLAPRVGIAFRPWTQHRLVIRAGYGLFYDGSIYQRVFPNLVNQPPFAQASILSASPSQALTLENGFPQLALTVARNTYAVDPSFRTPYGQNWNFVVEHEILRNVIFTLGYVGTKGTKLDLLLGPNLAVAGSSPAGPQSLSLRNAVQFTYETSGAASINHGLQFGLRRQFHGGLSVSGDYTFSKSIDDAAGIGGAGRTVAQNFLDLHGERGLSAFDHRHQVIAHYEYEFPFGDGRRFLSRGGGAARVIGNWQVSGVATLRTGSPFTARVLGNQSNNGGTGAYFAERADATGLPVRLPGFERTAQQYFSTAAFTLPPGGAFGDAGRNTIPGPRAVAFNMSLTKRLTVSREKRRSGEFRIEANNIFNTPNFGGLATVVNAVDFGRVTSVQPMRTLTMTMRFSF